MAMIHRIKCGNGNCYVVENGTDGILVDTGKREFADRVLEVCRAYHVRLIVLTHAHFDHAENAAQISKALGIPIGMNEADRDLISSNANQSLSAATVLGKAVLSASLKEFAVRAVPEFKPDLLLHMFYPTVSMLYHNRETMLESAGKISSLGDRTIWFGHGKPVPNRKWVK